MFEALFSDGHNLAFIIVSAPVIAFGVLANGWYLVWQLLDSHLLCSFTVFLGNLAFCNMLVSLVLPPVDIAILYYRDPVVCGFQRVFTSFMELEEVMLLLMITVDRVYLLLTGTSHYRHFVTIRHAYFAAFVSWIMVSLLIIFAWLYAGDVASVNSSDRCPVVRPHLLAVMPVAMDILILCMCVLNCKGRKTSTTNVQCSNHYLCRLPSAETQLTTTYTPLTLHGREPTYGMSSIPSEHLPDIESLRPSQSNISTPLHNAASSGLDSDKAESEKDAIGKVSPVGTGNETADDTTETNRPETEAPGGNRKKISLVEMEMPIGRVPNVGYSHRVSVTKSWKSRERSRASFQQTITSATTGFSRSSRGQACGDASSISDNLWYTHPKIKSTLPTFLSRTFSRHVRVEGIAAQQLALLLLVHWVLGAPAYICKLIASFRSERQSITTDFIHWLELLSALQACLYPLIFCLYSDRLRYHLLELKELCPCCSRYNRVRASVQY